MTSDSRPMLHQSFLEELDILANSVARLKSAHDAELRQLVFENKSLKGRLSQEAEPALLPGLVIQGERVEINGSDQHPPTSESQQKVHQDIESHVEAPSSSPLRSESAAHLESTNSSNAGDFIRTHTTHTHSMATAIKSRVRDTWLDVTDEAVAAYSSVSALKVHYMDSLSGLPSNYPMVLDTPPSKEPSGSSAWQPSLVMICSMTALHPLGTTRIVWNIASLFFIFYDLLILPLHAFEVSKATSVQVLDWIVTLWWTADVFVSFRTGYFVGSRLEMRHRKIAIHYAQTWLLCDCLVVLVEWVSRFVQVLSSASILKSGRFLQGLRFLRLLRVSKLRGVMEGVQEKVHSNLHFLCLTVAILTIVLLLTIHMVTCIWYALGSAASDGWVEKEEEVYDGKKGAAFWYIASARWVISQLNGRTDMNETRNLRERLFTCIVGVTLAIVMQAVFISFITKSMLDLTDLVSGKTRLERFVKEYLATNPLSPGLSSRVKRCLKEYYDINRESHNEEQVLSILPKKVQMDVLYEIRAPVIAHHNFYHSLLYESLAAMRSVCQEVVQNLSARKSEVVFGHGDECHRMLFTDKLTASYSQFVNDNVISKRGFSAPAGRLVAESSTYTLDRLGDRDEKLRHVPENFWISEAALWTPWVNQGTLTTLAHGFLYAVQPDPLARALKTHSDTYILATLYARRLVEELGVQDRLSDMLNFEVTLVPPIQLNVRVISAHDLRDADGFLAGKSDPYCVCKVVGLVSSFSETRFTTSTLADDLNPVWNYAEEVGLTRHHSLRFEVWDDDMKPLEDTLLGVAEMDPSMFYPAGFEGTLDLTGYKAQGCLKVKIDVLA